MTLGNRFVLFGVNEIDRRERADELAHALDPTQLATTYLDAREASPSDVRQAVLSPPFFGGQRVVVIDHLFGVSGTTSSRGAGRGTAGVTWTDVRDDIFNAPESTVIVITGHRGPPGSTSGQLRRRGWTVEQFPELRGRALIDWVVARAARLGAAIDQDAAIELCTRLYPTLWQREPSNYDDSYVDTRAVLSELEKLALSSSDGKIRINDVRRLVAERPGLTAFRLGDAAFSGDTRVALDELEQSLASGEAPEKILGQLAHQLTALQAARIADQRGVESVAEASGLSAGLISVTRNRKSGWRDATALTTAAEQLREAEWLVRTGRAARPDETLVPAVTAICEAFRTTRQTRG